MTTTQKRTGRSKSGHFGGNATKKKHGSEFYSRIGRLGGLSRKRSPSR